MKQYYKLLVLCVLLSVFLLNGCGKRPSEETVPNTTQPATQATESVGELEEGELPALTIPQQTEPATEPTEKSQPTAATKPTEGTKSPAATKPTEGTKSPATTKPTEGTKPPAATEPTEGTKSPETTQPAQPAGPSRVDEDELPPIPVG